MSLIFDVWRRQDNDIKILFQPGVTRPKGTVRKREMDGGRAKIGPTTQAFVLNGTKKKKKRVFESSIPLLR